MRKMIAPDQRRGRIFRAVVSVCGPPEFPRLRKKIRSDLQFL